MIPNGSFVSVGESDIGDMPSFMLAIQPSGQRGRQLRIDHKSHQALRKMG